MSNIVFTDSEVKKLRKNKYVSVLKNEFSIPAKFSMVNSKSQRMIDKSVTERCQ